MSEDSKDRIIQDFATNLIRLGNECRDWAAECLMLSDKNKLLQAEVERLRKAGAEMGKHLPDTDEANRAYIDFEVGGRS